MLEILVIEMELSKMQCKLYFVDVNTTIHHRFASEFTKDF